MARIVVYAEYDGGDEPVDGVEIATFGDILEEEDLDQIRADILLAIVEANNHDNAAYERDAEESAEDDAERAEDGEGGGR